MKIVKYKDIEPTRFDNEVAKGIDGRVVIGQADEAKNFCMRIFEIDPDGYTPKHSHAWEHEIFFHQGNGRVFCQGDWKTVGAGSVVFVPGDEEHQIKNVGNEKLIFVCLVPKGAPEL